MFVIEPKVVCRGYAWRGRARPGQPIVETSQWINAGFDSLWRCVRGDEAADALDGGRGDLATILQSCNELTVIDGPSAKSGLCHVHHAAKGKDLGEQTLSFHVGTLIVVGPGGI